MHVLRNLFFPIAFFLLFTVSCAGPLALTQDRSSAESSYVSGVEYLAAGMQPEATQLFKDIKTKYPYSRYTALAELRLVDMDYQAGKYIEAIEGYRLFLRFHPYHAQADWAYFYMAEALFHQIPASFWLMPPVEEKDLTSTHEAQQAYEEWLRRYPKHRWRNHVEKRLAHCATQLAAHELYVAQYYLKHRYFKAAQKRAEYMLHHYPKAETVDDALWVLAQAHLGIGSAPEAAILAERLVKQYPQSRHHKDASAFLERIQLTITNKQ
jgi:outer membrane protein assembly factor BamD